jgi:hypothetical protein
MHASLVRSSVPLVSPRGGYLLLWALCGCTSLTGMQFLPCPVTTAVSPPASAGGHSGRVRCALSAHHERLGPSSIGCTTVAVVNVMSYTSGTSTAFMATLKYVLLRGKSYILGHYPANPAHMRCTSCATYSVRVPCLASGVLAFLVEAPITRAACAEQGLTTFPYTGPVF